MLTCFFLFLLERKECNKTPKATTVNLLEGRQDEVNRRIKQLIFSFVSSALTKLYTTFPNIHCALKAFLRIFPIFVYKPFQERNGRSMCFLMGNQVSGSTYYTCGLWQEGAVLCKICQLLLATLLSFEWQCAEIQGRILGYLKKLLLRNTAVNKKLKELKNDKNTNLEWHTLARCTLYLGCIKLIFNWLNF